MFDYLEIINLQIARRYSTVLKDIRCASNSFYDAYLDMLEETVKSIAEDFNVVFESNKTCGALIKTSDMARVLKEKLHLDEYYYGKLSDYTSKVNHHKHHLEKNVSVDAVINYLTVFWHLIRAYAAVKHIDTEQEFDTGYFASILGVSEKENARLSNEVMNLTSELTQALNDKQLTQEEAERFRLILQNTRIENLELDEQNKALLAEISELKDIKLSSLEVKLNKALDMLLNLNHAVYENRAASLAIGDTIVGRERFEKYVERVKQTLHEDE